MKENYQKILDETIAGLEERGEVPKLLLHSCCAPCSSYVLEYLSDYFYITVLYYNPNIYPEDEYYHRAAEQKRFVKEFPTKYPVTFVEGNFEPERFYETVKGYENIREGGERCFRCYELRLREAAEYAKKLNCDYFMYRQDYCGCVFSKREREEQKRERAAQESEQPVQE